MVIGTRHFKCNTNVIQQFYKLYSGLVDSRKRSEIMTCLFHHFFAYASANSLK